MRLCACFASMSEVKRPSGKSEMFTQEKRSLMAGNLSTCQKRTSFRSGCQATIAPTHYCPAVSANGAFSLSVSSTMAKMWPTCCCFQKTFGAKAIIHPQDLLRMSFANAISVNWPGCMEVNSMRGGDQKKQNLKRALKLLFSPLNDPIGSY